MEVELADEDREDEPEDEEGGAGGGGGRGAAVSAGPPVFPSVSEERVGDRERG